ncbi:MAG: CRTAC1 family protein [Phycisphaerae bacterium]|mgnify:CR=1 FL=1|nr:CRTAC1 family protein [Phycisphaerae bacterium]
MTLLAIVACVLTSDQPSIRFTDVTHASGLDAVLSCGRMPSSQIPEVKGGGFSLIDFDNDGDLDLFMPNGATLDDPEHGPGARLFRNDSTTGTPLFKDVTAESGIHHTRWSFGSAVGDVDADGFDDIFIACFGQDVLLRNRGDATFEDVSAKSGLAAAERSNEWTTAAAFADLDGDGDLDLYAVNYLSFDPAHPPSPARFKGLAVMAGPKGIPAQGDRLFLNRGDGTFVDATQSSGVGKANPSYGLNVAILDFTGDGKPDIFVANDSQKNFLFVKTGTNPPTFEENGLRAGVATNMEGLEQASMGIAIGDIDGNSRPDVFTTNFSSDTNTLHLNLDGKYFDDRTAQFNLAAVSRSLLGWAAAFVDFDHDGDEDLLVVNGHVYPQASRAAMDSEYAQRPLLMERRGKRFETVTDAGEWKLEPHRDRTAVFADLDRDGDVDVIIGELNGKLRVIRNDHTLPSASAAKDWLIVEPRDLRKGVGNRHAVGAVLTARSKDAAGKELVQRRWAWAGGPFMSNVSPELHFGFPAGTTEVTLELVWPDGTKDTKERVALGERMLWTRQ